MGREADQRLAAKAAKSIVFTMGDALSCGLTAKQCRYRVTTRQWISVDPGLYRLPGSVLDWRGHLIAACRSAVPPSAASHRSALALWDLPGQRPHVTEIVTVHGDRVRRPGIVAHQSRDLPDSDITELDGIPVTTPARTVIDAAAVLHATTLELLVDEALRRGVADFAALWCRLDELSRPGRRGVRALRTILSARHPAAELAESVMEQLLLKALRTAGLPAPRPQYEIRDAGRFVARVDAAYPQRRIAIEYDSYVHHGGRGKFRTDLARRNQLTALGWRVVHVTNDDLQAGARRLCADVAALLRSVA